MQSLTFETVNDALVAVVPELREQYQKELQWWKGERPGPYNIFGYVLNPVLTSLLKGERNDEDTLYRIFRFFEEMATSDNPEVVNLLQVEELETLVAETSLAAAAWKYMGPATKALARETAKIWHWERNLPEGT